MLILMKLQKQTEQQSYHQARITFFTKIDHKIEISVTIITSTIEEVVKDVN